AGPEAMIRIRKRGLEFDRGGRGIDGVVDESQRAGRDVAGLGVRFRHDRKRRPSLASTDVSQELTRDRERDTDWRDLVDDDQRSRVRAPNETAGMYEQGAGATIDRRHDLRVLQLKLRVLDRRVVGGDRRLE